MTKLLDADASGEPVVRCRWCRRVLPQREGRGRPRAFCAQKCRQWHWVARQRAAELELSENELVITKDRLDALHDDLYILECAVQDTQRDLDAPGQRTAQELQELLEWLLEAAKPAVERNLR